MPFDDSKNGCSFFEKGVRWSAAAFLILGAVLTYSQSTEQFYHNYFALALGCVFAVANVKFYKLIVSGVLHSRSAVLYSFLIVLKFVILFLLIFTIGKAGSDALLAFFIGTLAFIPGACYHLYCLR